MFKNRNPQYDFSDLRDGVRSVVSQFDSRYWQDLDEKRAFPEEFVDALTQAGWLSALIPEEYGGSNLSLVEASVVMTTLASTRDKLEPPYSSGIKALSQPAWVKASTNSSGKALFSSKSCQ